MDSITNPLNLLATNMCSPMVIFVVYAVITGISLFITRTNLNKYNTQKMESLFNTHLLHEVKLLLIMGVVIYGLCQYNQVNIAWIFLIFPVIYVILKNIMIFISVSSANQNAPNPKPAIESSSMYTQLQQANEDKGRVDRYQQQEKLLPPPSVNKEIGGLGGGGGGGFGGGGGGGFGGGGAGLSPPLNSSLGGIGSNSNLASF